MMSGDLDWTSALGEAVVADQGAVLEAIQAFRRRAQAAGNLKSDDKQVVVVEKEVIKIVPANPEVIYVPQYNPTTVVVAGGYPAWGYCPTPYPVYYYPYPPGAAFATGLIWGAAIGAAWNGGHWNTNWGGGDININRNTNINTGNINRPGGAATRPAQGGGTAWKSDKRPGQVSDTVGRTPRLRASAMRGRAGPAARVRRAAIDAAGRRRLWRRRGRQSAVDAAGQHGRRRAPRSARARSARRRATISADRAPAGAAPRRQRMSGYGSGRQTQMDSSRGAASRSSMSGGAARRGRRRRRWRVAAVAVDVAAAGAARQRRHEPTHRNQQGTNPMNPTKMMAVARRVAAMLLLAHSARDVRGGTEDVRHARRRGGRADGRAQGGRRRGDRRALRRRAQGPRHHAGLAPPTAATRAKILAAMQTFRVLDERGADRRVLLIGDQAWPMPIPLVKDKGAWRFATEEGADELVNRRIGGNERNAIDVLRAYLDAQRQYASRDRDGDGVLQYAQKLGSTPGKHDGLYWPADAAKGEEPSPFGPLVAESAPYLKGHKEGDAYRGYHFKILTRQGKSAPGGAYSYVINGRMIAGFAMVAYPARYGDSGVMTFIVSNNGKIYEKDLGRNSTAIGIAMTTFDPGPGWKEVKE